MTKGEWVPLTMWPEYEKRPAPSPSPTTPETRCAPDEDGCIIRADGECVSDVPCPHKARPASPSSEAAGDAMTEERLAEIRKRVNVLPAWELIELLTEVDRLRAAGRNREREKDLHPERNKENQEMANHLENLP